MDKPSKSAVALYAIQYAISIVLAFCSALLIGTYGALSAILIGIAYVYYGTVQYFRVKEGSYLRLTFFGLLPLVLGIIAYVITINSNVISVIFGIGIKFISGIFILVMVLDYPSLTYIEQFARKKAAINIFKLTNRLASILVIVGMFIAVIAKSINALSIFGCAVWALNTVYLIYLMATYKDDDSLSNEGY